VSAFVVAEGQTRPSLRTRVRKTHLVGPRTTESAYFVLFEGHTVRNSSAVHNTAVFADDRNETERTYGNSKKNRSDRRLVARPKYDGVYRTRRIRRDDTNFPFRVRAPPRPTAPRTGQNARNRLRRVTTNGSSQPIMEKTTFLSIFGRAVNKFYSTAENPTRKPLPATDARRLIVRQSLARRIMLAVVVPRLKKGQWCSRLDGNSVGISRIPFRKYYEKMGNGCSNTRTRAIRNALLRQRTRGNGHVVISYGRCTRVAYICT